MKLYLSLSLLENLLRSEEKKKIAVEIEHLLQDGHRVYTSVYSILGLLKELKITQTEKSRTVLHLIDEMVEEILPLNKSLLEIVAEEQNQNYLSHEISIAKINGMDQILLCENPKSLPKGSSLPLRNFFREMDRKSG